jgi:hypothetical protein
MSRIDELQRLHEASNMGRWSLESGDPDLQRDIAAFCAMMNSWPAIHRVLVAARKATGDGGHLFIDELAQELRALDGGA